MLKVAMGLLLAVAMTGCGSIFGVDNFDAWGLKMKFNPGQDFHIGANAISSVDDRRGINQHGASGAIQPRERF